MLTSRSTPATRIVLGAVAVGALITLWWFTAASAPVNIPRPMTVLDAGRELLSSGALLGALLTSLGRVAMGVLIAFILGATLGIIMARVRIIYHLLDPLIETMRPIAPIALVPLAILWLGTGTESAIAIIAYSSFFPIVLNTYAAVREMGPSLIDAARTFGVSHLTIVTQIILPGAVPGLLVGARLGVGLAWASVIAAELAVGAGVGSTLGIGQLMFRYYQFESDPNPIVVCMIAVGVTGLLLDVLLREAGRLLMPWRPKPKKRAKRRAAPRATRSSATPA